MIGYAIFMSPQAPDRKSGTKRSVPPWLSKINPDLNSEIETTDSADFTDFQEVIGDERTNLFVAKTSGH